MRHAAMAVFLVAACSSPPKVGDASRGHRTAPDACRPDAQEGHCEKRFGVVGQPCDAPAACDADGKAMLECKEHVWALVAPCHGPAGCAVAPPRVVCDVSVAVVGELCEGEGASCAADGKTMLACTNGKWAVDRACSRACEARKSDDTVACR